MHGAFDGGPPSRQHGFILLLLLAVILSASALLLLSGLPRSGGARWDDLAETRRALQDAKAALLGDAISRRDPDGIYLPCPDTAYEGPPFDPVGSSNTPCGTMGSPSLGLLPWGTLRVATDHGQGKAPLWYAVSGNHKILPAVRPNAGLPGTLSVEGRYDVVAVVIAPGNALADQQRTGDRHDAAQYLEGFNQHAAGPFESHGAGNDLVIAITRDELEALLQP
jgi:hypothetical protein